MNTEKLYFYKSLQPKMCLDKQARPHIPFHIFENGIAYETKQTPQKFLIDRKEKSFQRSGKPIFF